MQKHASNTTDPSVSVLEEIQDQNMTTINGGTMTFFDCYVGYKVGSFVLGNKGRICTVSVECMNNCRP